LLWWVAVMSTRGAVITVLATGLSNAVRSDEMGHGCDIGAGIFGEAVSAWIRSTADAFIEQHGMLAPKPREMVLGDLYVDLRACRACPWVTGHQYERDCCFPHCCGLEHVPPTEWMQ
jgi:hypothetical protein